MEREIGQEVGRGERNAWLRVYARRLRALGVCGFRAKWGRNGWRLLTDCEQSFSAAGLTQRKPGLYSSTIRFFFAQPFLPISGNLAMNPVDTTAAQPLLNKLQWRYAAKKMNPAKKVPQEKVERILEAARLAPTSSGLQPFEIIVVTDPAVRAKIQPIAWNQAQITDGSHLLVFAAWDNYTADRINMMFDLTNDQRGFKNEGWENYRQMLLSSYPQRDAEVNFQHAARQAYIGMSAALIAAAFEEVDSTPME
eukprot:gene40890-54142_t